jgi:hypothetical protein
MPSTTGKTGVMGSKREVSGDSFLARRTPRTTRAISLGFDVAAALLCFVAWWTAFRQTHDLTWPCENDLYRDLGAAQSILDGLAGTDPAYLGEYWWYNPLVPAVVALSSRVIGLPLHVAYASFGAHLNLLGPIAFYAMVCTLFHRGVGLASLFGFLFLGPLGWMSWLNATYSPWLWPCNFAQGLFYLGILTWVRALRVRTPARALVAGGCFGLTALAHAAPALLLAVIAIGTGAVEAARQRSLIAVWSLVKCIALVAIIAALVSSPFWWSVVMHYHARVQNPVPLRWVAGELTLERWREVAGRVFSLRGVVAVLGLAALIRARWLRCRHTKGALLAWGGAAALGLAYGYAAQRITLPPLLPSWHFYFYLQALESVLFGLGVATLAHQFVRFALRSETWRPVSGSRFELVITAMLVGAMILPLSAYYPRYRKRLDLSSNRRDALTFAASPNTDLYASILKHVPATGVVLAEEGSEFYAVLAAGRKTVAIGDLFANPYVDNSSRLADSAAMFESLAQGNWHRFLALARAYSVRYVAVSPQLRKRAGRGVLSRLRPQLIAPDRERGIDLYELR